MFYDVFAELCEKRGIKPSKAAEECGINKSNVSNWKNNGYVPRGDALNKIAEYFCVSIDYLLGKEQKEKPIVNDFDGLQGVYLNFAKEAQKNDIDPDDIRLALDTIKRLKDK